MCPFGRRLKKSVKYASPAQVVTYQKRNYRRVQTWIPCKKKRFTAISFLQIFTLQCLCVASFVACPPPFLSLKKKIQYIFKKLEAFRSLCCLFLLSLCFWFVSKYLLFDVDFRTFEQHRKRRKKNLVALHKSGLNQTKGKLSP